MTLRGTSLVFDNVTASYGAKEVLHQFNLTINPGELVCLLGPSGCGKSTVLRCLAGFSPISSGDIRVGDIAVNNVPPRLRGMGMVFQQYSLFPNMSVIANVGFGLKIQGLSKEERINKSQSMLDLVGLGEFAHRFPHELSGGQQQRVALARALILNPNVLLLDEPLSALDAKIRVQLREEIRTIQKQYGLTTIFVTHDQEEALAIADRIAIMHDGNIEQIGTPEELYTKPATPFVANFVGNTNGITTTVRDDGMVQVCGTNIPLLTDAPIGQKVRVFIRPEHVRLQPDVTGHAQVEQSTFLGSIKRTTVNVDGMKLVSQHSPLQSHQLGDTVRVNIRQVPVMCELLYGE